MSISVDNKIVFRDDQDAAAATLVSGYQTLVAPIANAVVGSITANITRTADAEGESALGDVIADAQLAHSQPAGPDRVHEPGHPHGSDVRQLTGGEGDGVVTFGEAFAVQPFNNLVVTQDMTGAQIKAVLEQQWAAHAAGPVAERDRHPAGFGRLYVLV